MYICDTLTVRRTTLKQTRFNLWKKRNNLTTDEASSLLKIKPSSIHSINSRDVFTETHYQIMELYDENVKLKKQVTSLALKLAE